MFFIMSRVLLAITESRIRRLRRKYVCLRDDHEQSIDLMRKNRAKDQMEPIRDTLHALEVHGEKLREHIAWRGRGAFDKPRSA
ncbi:MAG: hypothetical protein WA021_03145 [Minisyncoccia bacterium]